MRNRGFAKVALAAGAVIAAINEVYEAAQSLQLAEPVILVTGNPTWGSIFASRGNLRQLPRWTVRPTSGMASSVKGSLEELVRLAEAVSCSPAAEAIGTLRMECLENRTRELRLYLEGWTEVVR